MKTRKYEHEAMTTYFEVMIACDDAAMAKSAAYAVFDKIDRLEDVFSRFLEVSDVAMISGLKPGETCSVSPETMDVLLTATEVCAATKGAFDVTVGSVMDALRDVKNRWPALTEDERSTALNACGMNRLIIDKDNFMVSVTPDRAGGELPLRLDFGAIGKGYVLDVARQMLIEDWEFDNFLVHAGTSTVMAHGSMDDGSGWPVAVGGDWQERAGLDAVRLCKGAISGSGFEVKGAHIVDARHGVAAAQHAATWSYAPTAALSDALSTAALGMSWKEIQSACAAIPGSGVMAIRDQAEWMDKLRKPVRICGEFPLK
ncbi:MAG: FAD:protein FMN transferase [Kiritimatiellae bacterium]|jgi:thiamine biosynthesis lipoprotein|nr:FAD:protein FMN transferase [Kiritimatiellia bacterium]